jgi:hypothetical protein
MMNQKQLIERLAETKNLFFYVYSRYSRKGYTSKLPKHGIIYMHEMHPVTGNLSEWVNQNGSTEGLYVTHRFTASGDYHGCIVELSNCKEMATNHNHIEVIGGYSSSYAAISLNFLIQNLKTGKTDEILEAYDSLNKYPLLNEDLYNKLEDDYTIEAWEDYIKDDLKSAIQEKFSPNNEVELKPGKTLEYLRNELMERSSTRFENEEGYSMYLDIDRMIGSMTPEDFGTYFTHKNEESE